MLILFLLLSAIFAFISWKYVQHLQLRKQFPNIPTVFEQFLFALPFRIPFIQTVEFDEFPNHLCKQSTGKPITKIVFGNEQQILLNDADLIREVFVKKAKNFDKPHDYEGFDVFGPNILSTNGKIWVKHRALCNMGFTAKHYEYLAQATNESTDLMFKKWSQDVSCLQKVNVGQTMADISFDILGKTVFGKDFKMFSEEKEPLVQVLIDSLNKDLIIRMLAFTVLPKAIARWSIFSKTNNFNRVSVEIDKLLQKQEHAEERSDLLTLLAKAIEHPSSVSNFSEEGDASHDFQHNSFSFQEIKSDIYIFLIAGFETTSTQLSWTLYHLARNPKVQEKLHQISEQIMQHNHLPNYEDFSNGTLQYVHNVIQESMRLNAPVFAVSKVSEKDEEIGGFVIPKHTTINANFQSVHLDERYWDRPLEFEPERFEQPLKNRFAFLPFSCGPRRCIGNLFSEIESCIFLTRLMRDYRVELLPGTSLDWKPKVQSAVTVKPKELYLQFIPR